MKELITVVSLFILMACSQKEIIVEFDKEIIGATHRIKKRTQFSILQGISDSNSAQFRIIYPKHLSLTSIEIHDHGKKVGNIIEQKPVTKSFSIWAIKKITVSGLKPNTKYKLTITSDHKKWRDTRHFKTFDMNKKNLKIAVSSCASDTHNEIGNLIWDQMNTHRPDLHLMIGDNVYADIFNGVYANTLVTPTHLWNRYMDSAMQLKIYRQQILIPTLATWDDHDYGINNGDKTYPYKKEAKKIFHHFFAQNKSPLINYGPGLSYQVQLANRQFIFLDARSFRDPENDSKGDHLGNRQRQWLKKTLSQTTGLTFLIMGDQYFGAYHPYESFEGLHPEKFKTFIDMLKSEQDNRIVFLTGDRHLVEVMDIEKEQLGYPTREYTVSGIHTKLFPGSLARNPNKRRIGGIDGTSNFGIFELVENVIKFSAFNELNELVVKSTDLKL